jgi:hypothetical protein
MATQRQKEIASLRSKLAHLEAEQEREEQERAMLEQAQAQLLSTLESSDISFESYVRCFFKDIRKLITKIELEQKKTSSTKTTKQRISKKAVKKTRRAARPKTRVKIPAGQYTNIPTDPQKVFEVKDKGPRPKALKAYAEEIGLAAFLAQCRKGEG